MWKTKTARTWGWNLCHWPFLQWWGSHFKQTSCYQDCIVIHPVFAVSQLPNLEQPSTRCGHTSNTLAPCSGNINSWLWDEAFGFQLLQKLPSLAMTRSMFTLLQASNGMDGCREEHCCAQINGQFILAPFAEVLTLDGWCDDIVRHVVYRQPVMGVVDLASWS